ncbi:hypothetical protein N7462_009597 [Penicillium macrosclerotiorum]|uniref:uncharacterized protein n=1 Tax=Penicillium macrosclerotiorum TaxID=303699 RepID=UPI002548FBFA|nr:uncharacterized protein N7462_009597 [Penicillium macrosclerotiorum]KAJ5674158.1 hypothetical protein N7462_009597 [Penicillium macrosclerotiorum]
MTPSIEQIIFFNKHPSSCRIFIIGGGIVGASLAYFLSKEESDRQIVIIDKCFEKLLGSTGHAPGFVGQLNESPALTSLAKDTVSEYLKIPGGFNVVGGLEVSSTPSGVETLHHRRDLALTAGLPAEIITPDAAASLAPDFIRSSTITAGLHFASDGTANAQVITSYYLQQSQARGVILLEATVTGFEIKDGLTIAIQSSAGEIALHGSPIVLATGIWTSSLASSAVQSPVPIVPVAHPYTFTPPRPPRSGTPYPFVRWLDHHVYARDHGDRDGLGSYDHPPISLSPDKTAIGAWPSAFDGVLSEATMCLKNGDKFLVKGYSDDTDEKRPFNGIFSVTPDNLPLAGKVPGNSNLWLCAAIWVTTAAGTAKLVSRKILEGSERLTLEDKKLLNALSPARFRGCETITLETQALAKYNDIYNRET